MTTATASAAQSSFTPWIPPPEGVESNPEHPESLSYKANITIAIAIPVVTLFFACRLWARAVIKRTWIIEDWLVLISWAGIIVYSVVMKTVMEHHGGQHGWDITAAQAENALYWFNIASVLYGIFIMFTKLSVLWLYRRVFAPIRWSPLDIIIVFLIVTMLGFYISTSIVKIVECIPRAKIFDNTIPGHCVDISALLNASGLFNTITDYIMLLLPVHAAWRLQLNQKKKLLIIAVFTFGLCAPIFSTVGFVVRIQYTNSRDTTWTQPDILLWGCAECVAGFLVVCFPEMSFLINRKSRKRNYPRRPTNNSFAGTSSKAGTQIHAQSRVMNSYGDDPYYELNDTAVYGVRISPTGSNSQLTESVHGGAGVKVQHDITVESVRKEDFHG